MVVSLSGVTALNEGDELPGSPSAVGVGEFEWPKSVGGLFEVGAAGDDLVDEVLNAWQLAKSLV